MLTYQKLQGELGSGPARYRLHIIKPFPLPSIPEKYRSLILGLVSSSEQPSTKMCSPALGPWAETREGTFLKENMDFVSGRTELFLEDTNKK